MTKIFFLALMFCIACKTWAIDVFNLIKTEGQLIKLRQKSLVKQTDLSDFHCSLKKKTFTQNLKTISRVLIIGHKESWTTEILNAFSSMQWPIKVPKELKPKWGLIKEDKRGYRIYMLFRSYEKVKKSKELISELYQIYVLKKNLKKIKKYLNPAKT